jgi:putative pyruvate formate lyase activating enzyme
MQTFTRLSHRILSPTHNHISHGPRILKRFIGIPPAFLLDDYIPRYNLLSPIQASKKRSLAYAHLRECNLCPRKCGVNRYEKTGICLIGAKTAKVNVIAPHRGEEPCIQGYHGSGSVFFSGCNLRCVFCQNHVCRSHVYGKHRRFDEINDVSRTSLTNAMDSTSHPKN